jgi:hypothetical protein
MRSRARLRRANQLAQAGSRQGPPRSGAGAPTRTPAAHQPHQPGTPEHAAHCHEATDLRAADPTQEHPPDSGPRQGRLRRRCAMAFGHP